MCLCVHRGGGIPACIADGIPACLAAALQGVVSQHALQVSRPTPKGEVGGLARGGLQAHTQGGLQAHNWGVSRPTPRGVVSRPTPGECIPAYTEADTPPMTATAAGGTHPTGMHSCFK